MEIVELKSVLRTVVLDVCPSDQDLFDIEADALIQEELAGKKLQPTGLGDVQSRFGIPTDPDTLAKVGTYIKLISSAIAAVKALGFLTAKPALSADQLAKLQDRWQSELEKYGLPAATSSSVAHRFSNDVLRAVAKK